MNVTPNILFLVYFFRQHVPECPVDRKPLDREKVTSGECRNFILDTRSLPSHAKMFESHARLLRKSLQYTKLFFTCLILKFKFRIEQLDNDFFVVLYFLHKSVITIDFTKNQQSLCSFGLYKLRPSLFFGTRKSHAILVLYTHVDCSIVTAKRI